MKFLIFLTVAVGMVYSAAKDGKAMYCVSTLLGLRSYDSPTLLLLLLLRLKYFKGKHEYDYQNYLHDNVVAGLMYSL